MKKEYIKPQTDVVELKMNTNVLLAGSPETMIFSQDSENLIDDPEDIH